MYCEICKFRFDNVIIMLQHQCEDINNIEQARMAHARSLGQNYKSKITKNKNEDKNEDKSTIIAQEKQIKEEKDEITKQIENCEFCFFPIKLTNIKKHKLKCKKLNDFLVNK